MLPGTGAARAGLREGMLLPKVVMERVPGQIRRQIVLIGNAAHSLHPVAGQGFNPSVAWAVRGDGEDDLLLVGARG